MLKVILHCQASDGNQNSMYGDHGYVRHELEKQFGEELEFKGFGGHLANKNLALFLQECENADVVIVDAWTHPTDLSGGTSNDFQKNMADIFWKVKQVNHNVVIFADLMEGRHEVTVHHAGAKPIKSWSDEVIICALEAARVRKNRHESKKLAMVVDDKRENRIAAREQLADEYQLITCDSYLTAIVLLDEFEFDIVMTDMLMPAEADNQGKEGEKYIGQEMAVGSFVAFKALQMSVKSIFVVSDTNHHDNPIGHVAELLSPTGCHHIRFFCGYNCPTVQSGDQRVKGWKYVLEP